MRLLPNLRIENRGATEIALGYAIVAALWILLSDRAVERFAGEISQATDFQTYKGLFFVLATSAGLFFMTRLQLGRLAESERRLAALNAELDEAVKERTAELQRSVEELENFSYTVSHDLRAPLRAIDGFSEILESEHGSRLGDDGRRLTGVVRKNCREMTDLVDGLLLHSRLGRRPLFRTTVSLEKALEKAIHVEQLPPQLVDLHAPLPPVHADAEMVDILLGAVLSNCAKFRSGDGDPKVVVTGTVDGGFARIEVRDDGIGFDMRYQDRVFKLFDKAHEAGRFPGTGIGLALAHRVVGRHGGQLSIASSPEGGTTVTFTLPVANA